MLQPHLNQSVGTRQPNAPDDVLIVQQLLNKHIHATHMLLTEDHLFGPQTERAIVIFQKAVMAMIHPDGIISPSGPTFEKLIASSVPPLTRPAVGKPAAVATPGGHTAAITSSGGHPNTVLTDADYASAAQSLSKPGKPCDVAMIKAVAKTETGVCGLFDKQGRPSILYERHYFSRLTNGRYDRTNSDISAPTPYVHYGKCSAQYEKLGRAEKLDRVAALESASWGAFQLMGANFHDCGFTSVDEMVTHMQMSIQEHLKAFVNFIKSQPGAHNALLNKNWAGFAKVYNGPGYKKNDYDTKMAQAYAEFSKK